MVELAGEKWESVYCQTKRRCILPLLWAILPALSRSSLKLSSSLLALASTSSADPPQVVLNEVYIGKAKDSLDSVDFELIIDEVVPVFGHFVKFAVGHKADLAVAARTCRLTVILMISVQTALLYRGSLSH